MKRTPVFIFFLLLLLALGGSAVQACGGFFCTTTPIDQNAERIIFTVNPDNTITAIVGINYVGAAEDFSWVVPVPSPPTLDVAETVSIDGLQRGTDIRFENPNNPCQELFQWAGRGGGGGGGGFQEFGQVGPYEYAILGSADPDTLVTWLRDFGYQVTEDMEPIIADYVNDQMYFLALRLSQDAEVGDIKPIMMTYTGQNPMIPLKLTAIAAVEDMPVYVWIFADSAYKPDNWANPVLDFSAFRAPHSINFMGDYTYWYSFDPRGVHGRDYDALLDAMQAEYDGKAFVTELSTPTSALPEGLREDDLLAGLISSYAYVTRHYAQLSPEQMTLDPVFVPDTEAQPVSSVIQVSDWVDPVTYWGCTTRTGITPTTRAALPTDHTRLDDLALDVAHPKGWQLSHWTTAYFESPQHDVYALSAEPVTPETIEAYLQGEGTQPLLLITQVYSAFEGWELFDEPLLAVAQVLDHDGWPLEETPYAIRHWPYGYEGALDAVIVVLLTPPDDYAAHQAMYDAMLKYADTFQFYRDPALEHTLFLDPQIQLAYLSGWVETTTLNPDVTTSSSLWTNYWYTTITLQPDGLTDGPRVRWLWEDDYRRTYNNPTQDPDRPNVLRFEADGRTGYLFNTDLGLAEFSAPTADFAAWDSLLNLMLEASFGEHVGNQHGDRWGGAGQ